MKQKQIKTNWLDKVIEKVSPVRAARRLRARAFLSYAGGYIGSSRARRSMSQWNAPNMDANAATLPALKTLRNRSRDLARNNPMAAGAIKTKPTNVVGPGLRLQSKLDRSVLTDGFNLLTEPQLTKLEARIEREWRLFWDSKECDAARTLTGDAITRQVYRRVKEDGDVFVLLPRINRPPFPYKLKVQVIEADRVCNIK